jgi:dihydrofolate reductase
MLSLIAAVAKNGCIGKDNRLPWHIPEDMKRFKEKTLGKVVIMGRKTWESLPEKFRPLPERVNVVISRNTAYAVPVGVELFASVDDALLSHTKDDVVVIGGAELYRQTMPLAETLFITHVDQEVPGDVFFPPIDPSVWKESEREPHDGFSFVTYQHL